MAVQVPSHAVHADGSVSVQEAAQILGCSEKTIRRRIKAGSIAAHRLPTSQGYEWRVHLNGDSDQSPAPESAQVDGPAGQLPGAAVHLDNGAPAQETAPSGKPGESNNEALLKALAFAERLQRENMELAGRVGFLQARLQATEEQLLALAAGPPAAPEQEAGPAPSPAAPTPWQRFLDFFRN